MSKEHLVWLMGVIVCGGCFCVCLQPYTITVDFSTPRPRIDTASYQAELLMSVGGDGEIETLEDATYQTVTGQTFVLWLAAVVERSNGKARRPGTTSGVAVLDRYLNKRSNTAGDPRPKRHVTVLDASSRSEDAHTTLGAPGEVATIVLRSPVLERWRAPSVEARACAINTLAHEWTHVVDDPTDVRDRYAFEDHCHECSTTPLVSYTVGAVAQCAYLADHAGFAIDIAACVMAVGSTTFDTDTCRPGWAASLKPPR